jgi:DNA-binding winged helix-turn-helix (wHTH) protein
MTSSCEAFLSFGPFRLFPSGRLLEKGGVPIALSSRAFDILVALMERPGQIVSHKELFARAWRNVVVGQNALRVHVAGLRKALGDGEAGTRYIVNIPGQGYTFVAEVAGPQDPGPDAQPVPAHTRRRHSRSGTLPRGPNRTLGRDAAVRAIAHELMTHRLTTVVGSGDIARTTLLIATAQAMLHDIVDVRHFASPSVIAEPALLAAAIASAFDLAIRTTTLCQALAEQSGVDRNADRGHPPRRQQAHHAPARQDGFGGEVDRSRCLSCSAPATD